MADRISGAAAEEDLPRDHDAEPSRGGVEHRVSGAGDRVARHEVGGGTDRLEQPTHRHPLTERHPPHLLVPGDEVAVGVVRDL